MLIFILLLIASACIILERLFPATKLPNVKGWWGRIVVINVFQAATVLLAGATWDRWLSGFSLFSLSSHLGAPLAGGVAYFISTFVYYWWHRYRHESSFFWRLCHQIHHSASRIEILTSFYKHPLEIVLNSFISAVLVYAILGCNFTAGAFYTLLTAVAEYLYHWNVKTPRWIGNFIQRPESHRVHHQRNRHTGNYADLPLWDMLFGTFHNPKTNPKRCGFVPEQERRFVEMLLTVDVQESPVATGLAATCLGCSKRTACMLQRFRAGEEATQAPVTQRASSTTILHS